MTGELWPLCPCEHLSPFHPTRIRSANKNQSQEPGWLALSWEEGISSLRLWSTRDSFCRDRVPLYLYREQDSGVTGRGLTSLQEPQGGSQMVSNHLWASRVELLPNRADSSLGHFSPSSPPHPFQGLRWSGEQGWGSWWPVLSWGGSGGPGRPSCCLPRLFRAPDPGPSSLGLG